MRNKTKKSLLKLIAFLFIMMNVVAYFHAYKFTHFALTDVAKTKNAKELSVFDKLKTLFLGINNPRPTNKSLPLRPYEVVNLQSSKRIECWHIKVPNSRGTVAIFHGFSGNKASMLDKSEVFNQLGFSTFLVDFIGSGGSEGNETTIGVKEAEDVKICFDYLKNTQKESNIVLFGTSMGAAAILKAAESYSILPNSAIIECPFGSMYKTTCARFRQMNVPCFPMAGLLVFWGGVQHNFWAFSHNPEAYSKRVNFPILLLYGEKDKSVSREEIDAIYQNLNNKKVLKTYPEAGHDNYLKHYKTAWTNDISAFLLDNTPLPYLENQLNN
jgi:uncharacterized protein